MSALNGNGVAMSLIFRKILGPLVLGWAPNCIVLGAQLASEGKKLVHNPVDPSHVCDPSYVYDPNSTV